MTGWNDFFSAQLGASAALAGLVFVGISINLAKIMQPDRLPNRALEALVVLLAVLIISSLMLVPRTSTPALGIEMTTAGVAAWVTVAALHHQNLRKVEPRFRRAISLAAVLGQGATLPFVAAGSQILLVGPSGVYWLVVGIILSYVVVFVNAWVLLIEINR